MTEIILPFVHLNGTSAAQLMDYRGDVLEAIRELADKLNVMAPNRRDYYPASDRWPAAEAQHRRRVDLLNGLMREIEQERNAIYEISIQ